MKTKLIALVISCSVLGGCATDGQPTDWGRVGAAFAVAAMKMSQAGIQGQQQAYQLQQQQFQQQYDQQQFQQQQETNHNLECINHSLKGESWVGC